MPPAVIASLAEELGLLSDDTRAVLRGAAVSGDPFEPDLAAAAADVSDAIAMDAFDELLGLGLIRATDVPRRFRFRHPLVRRAVYESAPGGWRLGAHERCAVVLAARSAPALGRAHHVEQSARHGDLDAVAVLAAAGTSALLRAPASAARLVQRSPAPDVRERAGGAARRAAPRSRERARRRGPARREPCRPARLPRARAGGRDRAAVQLTTTCASVERLLGRHDEAHARLRASLDRLQDASAPDAVALMIELALDALLRAEPEAVCEWAERALAAAREIGDGPLTAGAWAILALGHAVAERMADAAESYAGAAALVAALPDEELGARSDAAVYLTSAATFLDRYDEAVAHAERALRLGRAAGYLHPTLLPALGAAHFMRGRLAEATAILDAGVEAARLAGITQSMAWMLRNRALLALMEGDVEAAREMAEEALGLTQRLDESVLSAWAAMTAARASAMAGHSARAVEVLTTGDGRASLSWIPGAWRGLGFEALAMAYADLGRDEDAARTVAEAEAHAAALGLPTAVVWAARAAAVVALRAGDRAGRGGAGARRRGGRRQRRGRHRGGALPSPRRPRLRRGRRRGARGRRARARGRHVRGAAARSRIAMPPSRSCAAWAAGCTAARAPARPAGRAWPR